MPSGDFHQLLSQAAVQLGIEPEFWDIWGRHHETTPEAKQTILRALGVASGNREELERSLAERSRREWTRLSPPAVVAGEGTPLELPLNARAECLADPVHVRIQCEDGSVTEHTVNLAELPRIASAEIEGAAYVRVHARLPVNLPLGYHDVTVQCGGQTSATRYIVTPERAWTHPHLGRGGKSAGIAVSLYGVRSARNWGCGDFRDLSAVIDWVASDLGASFVALNPLHAIHNRRPFNTSPYLPNCIFYQNFIYLDIEGMEEYGRSRRCQSLRRAPAMEREIEELRGTPFVEYERVAALKLRFLKLAFAQFLRDCRPRDEAHGSDSPRAREFREYLAREGDLLEKFATYCALDEHLHKQNPDLWHWRQWPTPYQDPESRETREFRAKHWRSVMFYQYLQWQIGIQLSGAQRKTRESKLSIGLYHDLALATDNFGSDLWAHRPFYVHGCRVGSPPDDFAPGGQDWGFPPPNAERHREDGYRLYAESIRKNCRHGGALRIDHVMRLFRLYWIPEDLDAAHGAYVREQNEDFVKILALESTRNQVIVVGEDLGTVEPYIREVLASTGILSYRLFYFEKNGQGGFRRNSEYPVQALVSSTTHDLPTLGGFWTGADIQARRDAGVLDESGYRTQMEARSAEKQRMLDVLFELGLVPASLPRTAASYPELTGDLHNAVAGFLAGTPSQLLAINQEDLTKELAQQNLPGTTWQYPNWGRKMRFTVEELRTGQDARNFTAMFRKWIAETGRENQLS